MSEKKTPNPKEIEENKLESGTYEIIQNRLLSQGKNLQDKLNSLNASRKDVFGSIESELIATERINTGNNCIARDIVPVGKYFIFGYNVHIGLKSEVGVSDVFSVYEYDTEEHVFHEKDQVLISDKKFKEDFGQLYKYYKNTAFVKFAIIGPHLFMVFRIGKSVNDIKVFKWLLNGDKLEYIDNRSEHEFKFPTQHEFEWQRTHRDLHRDGKHPHISIQDRIFVETIGGDLTIKVEDNTDSGQGVYSEAVAQKEQTLDDSEIFYAELGNIILLKIKPYQEENFRYIVFNEKLREAKRIDSIEDSCVLLPDDHGIIFSNGYYLDSGELKIFDSDLQNMRFEKKIQSPNGEDFLYIFYNRITGDYILLSYNLISQSVDSPIICNGYSIFKNGEFLYFKTDEEPKKHHAIQIWQTPYLHQDAQLGKEEHKDQYLYKVGNKDVVRAMAECHEVILLTQKKETYSQLYVDLAKKANEILDAYYWIASEEAFNLAESLNGIKESASSAIDEFEKVTRVKAATKKSIKETTTKASGLLSELSRKIFKSIDEYVEKLAELRTIRGEVISLKDLRYVDLNLVEEFENNLAESTAKLSEQCVAFLLREDALEPYKNKVSEQAALIEKVEKVTEADKLTENIDATGGELELLIDIVSNLKIDDATQTTQIIENISDIYAELNNIKAKVKNVRKSLLQTEADAEFNAQLKLINQAVINYLDVSDTPQKCEEYLTKLMVQIEELEGKFPEFDEFIIELTEKRNEIYNAFETKKVDLLEKKNKKATSLLSAADRILKGVKSRISGFKTINEINGYFASDLMIDKVRDIIKKLVEMEDAVKSDDIQSRLKTIREDAIRQLKDKQDLFVEGENVIKFGKHAFSVNVQDLDLTMVYKDNEMYYHLTGTNFFEQVRDKGFLETRDVWNQSLVSENQHVYRVEYLAYQIIEHLENPETAETFKSLLELEEKDFESFVQQFMAPRYHEGYVKGVHDKDTALILKALLNLHQNIGFLRFNATARACAAVFWNHFINKETKTLFDKRIKGLAVILSVFPDTKEFGDLIDDIEKSISEFAQETTLFDQKYAKEAAIYLFNEYCQGGTFIISPEAGALYQSFFKYIEQKNAKESFDESLKKLDKVPIEKFEMIRNWLKAFLSRLENITTKEKHTDWREYLDEAADLIFSHRYKKSSVMGVSVKTEIEGLAGEHSVVSNGKYQLHYNQFSNKIKQFTQDTIPKYESYTELKKNLVETFKSDIRLDEFKPRVLGSFVRNKLIDEVYLPIVGDNLAKQMGVVGEKKRTDLMGLLLLISPPGYGKTTLMEYIASRLGLIFMKINGPAIGHHVTSIDPGEAPNATSKEELEKLNLAFEMGDNIMIYLDDIQHCNPEFLQKFISLCDGQRKIEGVYKGVTKTYDLRGKKVAVVMAGNPYTETGEKFQIPDMLANRADTYNLGDILGDTEEAFRLSYIENSLTSNVVLSKLTNKSKKDIYTLIRLAETDNREGIEFESNISGEELNEYVSVLKKMLVIQDVILKVNQQYIASAAQADDYRTEPAFKLQGSYRNMNKLAEKVVPIMNDKELETLILSHYEGESQTLTSEAESNLLKFKEMVGFMSEEEKERWEDIKKAFSKKQKLNGLGGGQDQFSRVLAQIGSVSDNLEGIKEVLQNKN